MHFRFLGLAAFTAILCAVPSLGKAQTEYTGNGHYYELVTSTATWTNAKANAQLRTFMGMKGHLATITSQGEEDFMIATFGNNLREKHLGCESIANVWTWVTGEPFVYTNWAPGEPNGDGYMNFHGANALGTWNDIPAFVNTGYFVEYESPMELVLTRTVVAGDNSTKGTVVLGAPAAQTTTVNITDDSSLVTSVPSVTIIQGTTEKAFQIKVMAVNSTIVTHVRATWGPVVRNVALTLAPLVPTAMAFTPTSVTGGNAVSCRLVINGVAGPSGRIVSISDNSVFAVTPAQVTVPPGGTQVIFNIETLPVTAIKNVTVTAAVSAGTKTGTFRITP